MLRTRYRRITFFFARVILSLIFWDLILPFLQLRRFSTQTRTERLRKIAIRFRNLATDMGGVMIKVGQFLSARVDVLPEVITRELANLQDEVAPETFEAIRQIAEAELGGPLGQFFSTFDERPMAAASLGQVHQAKLHAPVNGIDKVILKVQRPGIEEIIATDLAALKTVGKWIQRYRPISKRADVPALLNEFSTTTYQEIDYLAEGKNAETFSTNFKDRSGVRVPQVIWPYTTRRALTLEDVHAIKITDYAAISAAGIDRNEVAQRLFETYLQQIFEDGFFHADPHPGNLFVAPSNSIDEEETEARGSSKGWTLNFVDFGMVGRVAPNLKAGLREMAIGVGTQDSDRMINALQIMGVLLPGADVEFIRGMVVKEFDYFWGKSMTELQQIDFDEMKELANEYREVIYDLPFQVPENLIFLGRCVAILSGMCTGLNPDFNLWEGLAPFAQKLIAEEVTKDWHYWVGEIGAYTQTLISLPQRLEATLQKMERGEMAVDTPNLNRHAARLEKSARRMTNAVVFAVLFLSGIQLYLANELIFGLALLIGSVIPLLRIMFPGR